jgi:hypothetical protein
LIFNVLRQNTKSHIEGLGGDLTALHTWPTIKFCLIQALDTVTDRKQEQNPQDYSSTGFDSAKANPLFHVGRLRDCVLYRQLEFLLHAARTGDITGL